ncbi:MAG: hypothetical protein CMB80_17175 [Flammeovirgaceae bacterium]|nr:hypothetical protein [Flammeovirgaceae bacterium]
MCKLFNTNGIESNITIDYLVNLNQLSTKHFNAMNRLSRFYTLVLFATALTLGSCAQDETMDEIIDNTEIGKPIQADGTDGDGTGAGGEKDKPDPAGDGN